VRRFAKTWIRTLRDSDFAAGCPVVAASLEGDAGARDAAAAAFASWVELLAGGLEAHVDSAERAGSLATLVVASIEGAVVMARAQRSSKPLQQVTAELEQLLVAAIVHSP
jgi:hypothetical protein